MLEIVELMKESKTPIILVVTAAIVLGDRAGAVDMTIRPGT